MTRLLNVMSKLLKAMIWRWWVVVSENRCRGKGRRGWADEGVCPYVN
jgi:hypothetical protein